MGVARAGLLAGAAICLAVIGCGGDAARSGDEIKVIADEVVGSGEHTFYWDQSTNAGEQVGAGTYGARVMTDAFDSTAVFRIIKDKGHELGAAGYARQHGRSESLASGAAGGAGTACAGWRSPGGPPGFPALSGYAVWTGSEAYVVGELVDAHVFLPDGGPVRVSIVKL